MAALSPEQERAAIVAYTGLWQLRELDPGAETAAQRMARLELRDGIDASVSGDGDARRPARQSRRLWPVSLPHPRGQKRTALN